MISLFYSVHFTVKAGQGFQGRMKFEVLYCNTIEFISRFNITLAGWRIENSKQGSI